MRLIKFRGKIDNRWAYSTPDNVRPLNSIGHWNWEQFWCSVGLDTVGQYVGMDDKHGKEIYDGDILGTDSHGNTSRGIVEFHKGAFKLRVISKNTSFFLYEGYMYPMDWEDWVVIGNIHDDGKQFKLIGLDYHFADAQEVNGIRELRNVRLHAVSIDTIANKQNRQEGRD